MAPDGAGHCELCAEGAHGRPSPRLEDAVHEVLLPKGILGVEQNRIMARLFEEYGLARVLLAGAPRELPDHEHLEWILGGRRDAGRDRFAFASELVGLVVLWLEDFALELEAPARQHLGAPATVSRSAAAARLRTATREFAAAFLAAPQMELEP